MYFPWSSTLPALSRNSYCPTSVAVETVVENFECFERDAGNPGIERALPEFLNRVRASNSVAAGRQHLPIRRVQTPPAQHHRSWPPPPRTVHSPPR